MAISIGGGISIGGNVKVTLETPSLVIPLNDTGGVTGWAPGAASIPYSATVIANFPVGSTITFQDGTTATIVQWDNYGPTYIDIFWNTSKTGTIFPITLSAG
jgi:hypothetical protein